MSMPPAPPVHRRKVYAYITEGERLLVFQHVDIPEAGLQVPGGTVEAGESFQAALLREIEEESGLTGLEQAGQVGEQVRDMSDIGGEELQQQRFYHLRCTAPMPEHWDHLERHASDGSGPLRFEFFWVRLEPLPTLTGDQGRFLAELARRMHEK
jgi:ADP-ribose pyrophosphatase YjhB (NUDIX family)